MSDDLTSQPGTVLLVEDNEIDAETVVRAFRKARIRNPLRHCGGGDDALDFLHRRGAYRDAPRPCLVLLDLNMPGTDGFEVLKEIKGHEDLAEIPVIVLTSSGDPHEIERCYDIGASSYVQKPVDLAGFVDAVQRLKDHCFDLVLLPTDH